MERKKKEKIKVLELLEKREYVEAWHLR